MLYLLWSLLNFALLIWFLRVCFSVLKLVRENMGMPALIIFILGSLSFTKDRLTTKQEPKFYRDNHILGLQTLEEGMVHDIMFSYAYPKDSLDRVVGSISSSGLVMGHEWETARIDLQRKDGFVYYEVIGVHEWKLLGLTLYSEPKRFTGEARQ